MLSSITPIDGRYANKVAELQEYFSEAALIKYRIKVEIEYFIYLSRVGVIGNQQEKELQNLYQNFTEIDAEAVKSIEKTTNHDVKAVEYFIKKNTSDIISDQDREYVHFGLTSQDINNTAMPLMIKGAMNEIILPLINQLNENLSALAQEWRAVPMLSRTHGQAASPSTVGKELMVFVTRIQHLIEQLRAYRFTAKFGGATGNFNAHRVAYPNIDWPKEMDCFIAGMGLERQQCTTQIEHYDGLAELFHICARINTVLIDLSRDIWTYISMNYFGQKVIANEVGSSAMPHKVNPIDFENAEGNLGLANTIFEFLARKLPVSRLQRDLTDSTVSRNIGVPFAHSLIAMKSLLKGLSKLELNAAVIHDDLTDNWAVVAEAIQTILRREGYPKPYEALKTFSRGKGQLTRADFEEFINSLAVSDGVKKELHSITPHNYIGYAAE